MKRFLFKSLPLVLTVSGLLAGIFLLPDQVQAYQDSSTPSGVFITVIYTEPMNVRSGPSTSYDILGQIAPGETLPALGISPGREWIQVEYPKGPGGVGWVYASYVSISGGELRIVEPPPTQTPLVTSTFDPTLAAAFNTQPTETRVPTFTPPPPLVVPTFTDDVSASAVRIPTGLFVMILGVIGAVGLLVSYVLRK